MSIHIRQEGRSSYLEADTIADWVKALSMDLPVKAPPELRRIFAVPDSFDDFATTEQVMLVAERLRAQLHRKRRRRRPDSSRRDVGRRAAG